jgi:hypothetical protein
MRATTLIVALFGAGGSLGLMLWVGRRNNSLILLALFAIWVLSPFVALLIANVASKSWATITRATLYSLTLVLTLGSLAVYGNAAFGPPRDKPAAVFLITPIASWLLIAILLAIAMLKSRRPQGRNL